MGEHPKITNAEDVADVFAELEAGAALRYGGKTTLAVALEQETIVSVVLAEADAGVACIAGQQQVGMAVDVEIEGVSGKNGSHLHLHRQWRGLESAFRCAYEQHRLQPRYFEALRHSELLCRQEVFHAGGGKLSMAGEAGCGTRELPAKFVKREERRGFALHRSVQQGVDGTVVVEIGVVEFEGRLGGGLELG